MAVNMERFLRPRSIAIVGAAKTPGAIGNSAVVNLKESPYEGEVHCVNPKYDEIEGYKCYPSLLDIESEVDVVIITTPGQFVEPSLLDAGKKGIPFAIIFSAGFAEMGEEGKAAQTRLEQISKEHNIRVIGPNTLGTVNFIDKINLSFSTNDHINWKIGDVGIVSQSGATGFTMMNAASEEEVGFAYAYTVGNQMDLTTLDLAESLLLDDQVQTVAMYMEAISDGEHFKQVAKRAHQLEKPLVIYKSGFSEAGQKAALSHTASLTGSNVAYKLAVKKYGIVETNSINQMVIALKSLKSKKYPSGGNVASVVISGAMGIMMADSLSDHGMNMVELNNATLAKLREEIPAYLPVGNPVDIASSLMLNPAIFVNCIKILDEADEVESILIHLPLGVELGGLKFANDILEVAKNTTKPIFVVATGVEKSMEKVRKHLTANGVPTFAHVEDATLGLSILHQYQQFKSKVVIEESSNSTLQELHVEISQDVAVLTEPRAKEIINNLGVPIPKGKIITSVEEIEQQVERLQFPVVAKIISPDITHKSDAGGVILPIHNVSELKEAYTKILSNVQQYAPSAQVDGVLVEEIASDKFLEAIVGISNDPTFGPIITCGLGGIYVEVMKDISQRLAPITEQEAYEMIEELKASAIFKGIRKGLVYDAEAYAKTLVMLSNLPTQLRKNWSEVEINPMVVFEKGKGVMALDALITFETDSVQTFEKVKAHH